MSNKVSPEVQAEAERIASGTKRPGQTKEQTKAIRQGIEKGIAEYKKQQKAKARERDKMNKKEQQQQAAERQAETEEAVKEPPAQTAGMAWLPWMLLVVSWVGFGAYLWLSSGMGQ
ncbi:DUF2956 domain-containing protein [Saccharospirillum salsuginis]|uniref:Membrane protein n=1 Tax=Saccharospirillum salsuginis TaxID=418750 RepID=A0A918K1X6_9GAMM|nr:DUF2956 domain-containing protein [Saccharospirillum salsuginis]GGX38839.1 membrane protein [Saccharospirillum salsuginis]